ncbi:hypothetical protein CRG98_004319 [Punica granatum]|uniref:Uncharacterized protein n=1 Tax=Punica granatum TaxID=22663 RepID=A0A2I0L3J3_PUNGR|nr:hypothetical protein CRG98_004319 [Punica granatum]
MGGGRQYHSHLPGPYCKIRISRVKGSLLATIHTHEVAIDLVEWAGPAATPHQSQSCLCPRPSCLVDQARAAAASCLSSRLVGRARASAASGLCLLPVDRARVAASACCLVEPEPPLPPDSARRLPRAATHDLPVDLLLLEPELIGCCFLPSQAVSCYLCLH